MKVALVVGFSLIASFIGWGAEAVSAPPAQETRPDYVLGVGDQISVWMMGIDDPQTRIVGVDPDGNIDLPMAGRIRAAGLSLRELRAQVIQKLGLYIKNPQCSITITDFRSEPVYLLGQVKDPGARQLQGGRRLLEVLSLAGGLAPDAGQFIQITREKNYGPLPVEGATTDEHSGSVTGQIRVADLMDAKPELNIEIMPHDVISVTRARMVYVMGEVGKPGAFVLNERANISILQALSMAGGISRTASPAHTRILRYVAGSTDRHDQTIDLRKILDGKSGDITLYPDDILFVPNSLAKNASLRAIEAGIQIGTGVLIWR